jgi:hypothetical protein
MQSGGLEVHEWLYVRMCVLNVTINKRFEQETLSDLQNVVLRVLMEVTLIFCVYRTKL